MTFDAPGVHTVVIEVTDDDGDTNLASLPKVVTDNQDCTRSQGFWKHQFSGKGKQQIAATALAAYLAIADFASAIFSEQVPASTIEETRQVTEVSGPDVRDNAEAQLLPDWMNFVQCAVNWDELIDTNGDDVGDTPFHNVSSRDNGAGCECYPRAA